MRRDEGEAQPHSGFTVLFDNPTNTVRENGTVGDEGKAASRRHTLAALLFVGLDVRCGRSLDDVYLAKAKGLYKRAIYPPPAV